MAITLRPGVVDDAEILERLEADSRAALDYLCTHAEEFPEGREVAECLARQARLRAAGPRSVGRRAG